MAERQSDPDIFGEFVADHARHRALLAALDATSGASPARKALWGAANCQDGDFAADAPNRNWAGDITCVRTSEGWLYLAVSLELHIWRQPPCAYTNVR